MTALAGLALCVAAAQGAWTRESAVRQEPTEKKQDAPPPPQPVERSSELSFLDLDRLEIFPRIGIALFSDDFESDRKFCAGAAARAPMPWFSRGVLGMDADDIGAFLDVSVTTIDRELEPEPDDPSGTLLFVSAGIDANIFEQEYLRLTLQAGLQYAHLGGVSELDSGLGGLFGGTLSLKVAERFSLAVNPQLSVGEDGDHVILVHLGVIYRF